jgi:DNA-binding PucR family transcriptional regulator
LNSNSKRERFKERIETHLRRTARRLVKFDTLEETLNCIIDSFWMEFTCDLVAVILKDNNFLISKVCKGGTKEFEEAFPIPLDQCSPNLLEEGWTIEKTKDNTQCNFQKILKNENISTWFTLPLKDEDTSLGFCIIGFHHFVPIIAEAERIFVEFGKDVAVAMKLAQTKEIDKKKMKGFEWINENVFLGSSIEQLVEKIVERACRRTNAKEGCIYLFDQTTCCFLFQPPSFGPMLMPEKIKVEKNYRLNDYFPYLEKPGEDQLTVPLIVNLKIIGVLHTANKQTEKFTLEDLEILKFLSTHISALIENTRLYKNEIELKQRLQTFMGYHQELVKQTLEGQNFDEISKTLRTLFSRSIFLFDRFLRPITHYLYEMNENLLEATLSQVEMRREEIKKLKRKGIWIQISNAGEHEIGIWPVVGGGDLLGYLGVHIHMDDLDDVLRLTIEHALNVYAIQFIKQKLVVDTREQVRDSFINKLLVEKIEDRAKLIEYANFFNWNYSHRVSILTIQIGNSTVRNSNLFDQEAQKSWIWELVKDRLSVLDQEIILSRKGDEFILIVPVSKEVKGARDFWQMLYNRIRKLILNEYPTYEIYLGVGGKTESLEDYYLCYKQAVQAHKFISLSSNEERVALFEELGSYTLLNDLKDPLTATLFVKKYLSPLLNYTEGKGTELLKTLRIYLYKNGNLKDTSEDLYIHRSTLNYRIEKIHDILKLDLENAEHRFNLMLAFKLYDLYFNNTKQT